MKCKILLLAHDKLSESFFNTIRFIYGDTNGFGFINMPEPFDQNQYLEMIKEVVDDNPEGLLILTDLFGGSPFINSCRVMKENREKVEIITGYNLPMVLELAAHVQESSIEELKELAIKTGSMGIIDVKERLK